MALFPAPRASYQDNIPSAQNEQNRDSESYFHCSECKFVVFFGQIVLLPAPLILFYNRVRESAGPQYWFNNEYANQEHGPYLTQIPSDHEMRHFLQSCILEGAVLTHVSRL